MSLDFDGSNDDVEITSVSGIDNMFQNPGGSIGGWFQLDGYGGSSTGRLDYKNLWFLRPDSGTASLLWSGNGVWRTPTNSISIGPWFHYIFTYNGVNNTNVPIFYINGVAQTLTTVTAPVSGISSDAGFNFLHGSNASHSSVLDGRQSLKAFWKRIITPEEVRFLYLHKSLQALRRTRPYGYWSCFGVPAAAAGNLPDLSSNGLTGVPHGSIVHAGDVVRASSMGPMPCQ